MTIARNSLILLTALFSAASSARAADDDGCVLYAHQFIDYEVDVERNIATISSAEVCVVSESSPDPAPGPGLDKPDHGGTPDWTLAQDCEATKLLIEQMRAALRHAQYALPRAREALASTAGAEDADQGAYERARRIWEMAVEQLRAAKEAYEDAYLVEVERERNGDTGVVVVRWLGYDLKTELGRAVADAMAAEAKARADMDAAWSTWSNAQSSAQIEQGRVDFYQNIVDTYPGAIEAALASLAESGC